MKVKLHSEEDKKLSFWLNDFKADFEDTYRGISLEYSFYTNDEDYYTSITFQFYPQSFRTETFIDISHCDVHEIMDKIHQRISFKNII